MKSKTKSIILCQFDRFYTVFLARQNSFLDVKYLFCQLYRGCQLFNILNHSLKFNCFGVGYQSSSLDQVLIKQFSCIFSYLSRSLHFYLFSLFFRFFSLYYLFPSFFLFFPLFSLFSSFFSFFLFLPLFASFSLFLPLFPLFLSSLSISISISLSPRAIIKCE